MAEIGVMKKLTIGGSTYTIPEYNLPIASASTLGGVKIGTGLSINSTTGVLSATGLDYDEADPIFTASPAYGITQNDISNWNSKTSNTGTVTSVAVSAGTGISVSGSPISSSGTITVTNTGVTGVKGGAESTYRTGQVNITAANIGAVTRYDELLTTNPFAPPSVRGPYISKIDNAFYVAHKRFSVTYTGDSVSNVSNMFDGSYESQFSIDAGGTVTITIDCSATTTFPGYPYGNILISFYHNNTPQSVSGRVYCNYEPHGIGWHDITFSPLSDNGTYQCVYKGYNGKYAISKFEITINAQSSIKTYVTQIEMHLDRPDASRTPFVSKYQAETLYYNLTAPKFIGDLEGNVSGTASISTKTGTSVHYGYFELNNEVNFGGSSDSSTIYFGYRAKDSRPIPTKFVFGSSTGTADLQAKTLYLGSGTTSYISNTQYTGNAASASSVAWSGITSKPTTLSGYGITDAYTKTEVNGLVSGVLHYKGTKATVADVAAITSKSIGDVWHVTADGSEWAYDGDAWQELGTAIDLSGYVTTDDSRLSDARTPLAHNQALSTITGADDLKAIEALTGTSGLLKKTAANTWTLDTNTYLTSYTETDPTVPSWAKASTKPTYTASEVGALPDTTVIPTKTSHLTNDSGFITSYTDEKVKQTPLDGVNSIKGLLIGASTGSTETTSTVYTTDKIKWNDYSRNLYIYNIDGTKYSYLNFYNLQLADTESNYYGDIRINTLTAARRWYLPDKNGTIALTSDIPDVSGFITSDSDEKVKVAAGSTDTSYYPVLATGAGTATRQYLSTAQLLNSSSYGTELILGKGDGTNQGLIQLWSKTSGYYTAISPANTQTANRGIKLPDKDGTLALTSDLSEYVSMNSTITNAYVYGSSVAKIALRGIHVVDNIAYSFRALATAPSLYNVTNDTEIWKGYTTLNKPTASDVGAVPTSRTINGHALTSNITLGSADVGVGAYQAYTIQSTTVNTGSSNYTALKLGSDSQTGVTLSAGRYLIYASVQFPAATSGTYGAAVLKSGTALSSSRQKYGFTNTVQRIQTIGYSEFDGTDTFGIGAYQTGASSQAITGYAMWVRLRDDS